MMSGAEIRGAAVQLLLNLKIDRLPIDPFAIAKKMNILVVPFNEIKGPFYESILDNLVKECLPDAFCCSPKGKPVIFYDDTVTPLERIRFSIAHELGHIVQKHLHVKDSVPRIATRGTKDPMESEADIFAAELLTPQGLLYTTGLYRNPGDIKKFFKVSYSVARNRSERLKGFSHRHVNKREAQLYYQIFE